MRPPLMTLAAVFSRYANLTWGWHATITTLHGQIGQAPLALPSGSTWHSHCRG